MNWDTDFALEILPTLLGAFGTTLLAVATGFAAAVVLGLGLCLLRRSPIAILAMPTAFSIEFIRSTPLLIQIYLLYFGLPATGLEIPPLAIGVIALGLHYGAYLSEVYRSGLDNVPNGQWQASRALGLSTLQCYRHVILPQAIPPMLPVFGNYLIAMFKDTPMLSAIAVIEVLHRAELIGKATFRFLEPITIVGILYLIASLIASRLVSRLEAHVEWSH